MIEEGVVEVNTGLVLEHGQTSDTSFLECVAYLDHFDLERAVEGSAGVAEGAVHRTRGDHQLVHRGESSGTTLYVLYTEVQVRVFLQY